MVYISPEIAVNSLLKQGVMLKAAPNTLFKTDKNHCVILLNLSPHTDDFVVFVCVSSQYVKRLEYAQKLGLPVDTVVMIKPAFYHHLPKYSAVDCNSIHTITKGELVTLYSEGRINFYSKTPLLNNNDVNKIKNGVVKSPLIQEEIKKMIIE
jgi:hypothetical protein